jgi:hypothetical protein
MDEPEKDLVKPFMVSPGLKMGGIGEGVCKERGVLIPDFTPGGEVPEDIGVADILGPEGEGGEYEEAREDGTQGLMEICQG